MCIKNMDVAQFEKMKCFFLKKTFSSYISPLTSDLDTK